MNNAGRNLITPPNSRSRYRFTPKKIMVSATIMIE